MDRRRNSANVALYLQIFRNHMFGLPSCIVASVRFLLAQRRRKLVRRIRLHNFFWMIERMATDPLSLLVTGWLASAIVMALLWIVDCRLRNASIADVGWCYGLALVVLWYASSVSGEPARRWLVAVMVFCYAVRLGTHVLVDRVWNKTEDGRYRSLRLRWGKQASTRMFGYFQLQAAAIALFSLPPLVVMQNPHPPFHFWDLAGFLLWSVAVIGETVADRQLAAFRGKAWNKDRVCRIGLWRYSRPPTTSSNGCTGGVMC